MDDQKLYRAPRNSLGEPLGADRHGQAGRGRIMLARLEWERETILLPVEVVWIGEDRVLVSWPAEWPSGDRRRTWLPRADVIPRARVR